MPVPVVSIYSVRDYGAQIRRAADLLIDGKLIIIPTETLYGAAGLLSTAGGMSAMKKLRGDEAAGKPFTIHLADPEDATQYLDEKLSDLAQRMIRKLWPGPVGLVFDVSPARRAAVASRLKIEERDIYAADGTITLRCPDDTVAQDIIRQAQGPVALTVSWDLPAGSTTSSPAAALAKEMEGKVELVIDAGPPRYAQPSTIVRVRGEKYEIIRKGIYDERIIERLLRTTILFVCSGNTCRSPMSEALARQILAKANGVPESELEKKGIIVASAGAYATPGSRAASPAVDVLKSMGADLSSHRSRQLTPELIHQADVIFAMARGHALAAMSMAPSAQRKVMTLDPNGDIDDPIGGSESLYRELAGELRRLIESRLRERDLLASK